MGLRERVDWRARGPPAGRARAPPRPARAPSPRAPLLAPGGGCGLARPGWEEGAREGPGSLERAGRPAAGNVSSAFFSLLPAPGVAASKKRS